MGPINYKGLLTIWEEPSLAYTTIAQRGKRNTPSLRLTAADHQTDCLRAAEGYHYLYRINCGGDCMTDEYGQQWHADDQRYWHSWAQDFKNIDPRQASQRHITDSIRGTQSASLFHNLLLSLQAVNLVLHPLCPFIGCACLVKGLPGDRLSYAHRIGLSLASVHLIGQQRLGQIGQYAIHAYEEHWGYVWGTFGHVLTESLFEAKLAQYPDALAGNADFIRQTWVGGRTTDCVGLIKGYGWLDAETEEITYNTNGMPDISANEMYHAAIESGTIDTIPETPGLAVWHDGHIGSNVSGGEDALE